MQPRRGSLLRTIQNSVGILESQVDKPEWLSILNVIDTCANELLHRESPDFFVRYYRDGRGVAERGNLLLPPADRQALDEPGEAITDRAHPDAIQDAIVGVSRSIERIMERLAARQDAEALAFFKAASAWETSLYAARMEPAAGSGLRDMGSEKFTRENLQAYLRRRFPELGEVAVTNFRMISGGFSKFTILLETQDAVNGTREMVARIEPPVRFLDLDGMDIRNEYPVVLYAFRAGLPVAEPLWLEEDAEQLGMRFFVSRKARGEIYGTFAALDRAIPPEVMDKLAITLAQIHRTPLDRDDPLIRRSHLAQWLDYPTTAANTLGLIDYWARQRELAGMGPSPTLIRAIAWLRANVPTDEVPFSLIHGDFGPHNLLIADGQVQALLDWENSRIGDPAEELARFFLGMDEGFDRQAFLKTYYAAGGTPMSEYRLRYFHVYAYMYNSVSGLSLLARLDHFERININWSVFGLRYTHHFISNLERLIEAAEAARGT